MVRRIAAAGLAIVLALATGSSPLRGQQDEFRWSTAMARGGTLRVEGISGDIHATLASGSSAEVVATKRGRSADFDQVTVEVVEDGNEITVCVVYARWERGRDACDRRGDGTRREGGERRSIDVSVDFEVRLPAGVDFVGAMVSGDVEVEDVRSEVEASTVSGDVFVSTSGVARGKTVSGSIEIEMGSGDWRELELATVSGDITLHLPAGVDTEVEFESLSGDFHSDFDVSVRRRSNRFIGSRLQGTIGDGGRTLVLSTVSGDVRLRRLQGS